MSAIDRLLDHAADHGFMLSWGTHPIRGHWVALKQPGHIFRRYAPSRDQAAHDLWIDVMDRQLELAAA